MATKAEYKRYKGKGTWMIGTDEDGYVRECKKIVVFEAWDVNDPAWDRVIDVLSENIEGFEVRYGDGNNMIFVIPDEQ